MELIHRSDIARPLRLGVLAGTFNPPTRAHVALARSALGIVDEVLFALPRVFPHKVYTGATFEERLEMLRTVVASEPRFSLGVTEGGLFIDIARSVRDKYGDVTVFFLCGRDAAERIVHWDYGEADAFERMLQEFRLLVAPRQGAYEPPATLHFGIEALPLSDFDECSATRVREAIVQGGNWRELVPEEIAEEIDRIFGTNR